MRFRLATLPVVEVSRMAGASASVTYPEPAGDRWQSVCLSHLAGPSGPALFERSDGRVAALSVADPMVA